MQNAPKSLWLDDLRSPPDETWLWCRSVEEAISALQLFKFEHVSLDHDMGLDERAREARRGSEVLDWMVANGIWPRRKPTVHSSNAYAATVMRKTIERYWPR